MLNLVMPLTRWLPFVATQRVRFCIGAYRVKLLTDATIRACVSGMITVETAPRMSAQAL